MQDSHFEGSFMPYGSWPTLHGSGPLQGDEIFSCWALPAPASSGPATQIQRLPCACIAPVRDWDQPLWAQRGKTTLCRNRLSADKGPWQFRPVTACTGNTVKAKQTGYTRPFAFALRDLAAACFDGWMAVLPRHLCVSRSFPLIFQLVLSFPVLPGWPFAEEPWQKARADICSPLGC